VICLKCKHFILESLEKNSKLDLLDMIIRILVVFAIIFFMLLIYTFCINDVISKKFNQEIMNEIINEEPMAVVEACLVYVYKQLFFPGYNPIKSIIIQGITEETITKFADTQELLFFLKEHPEKVQMIVRLIPQSELEECFLFISPSIWKQYSYVTKRQFFKRKKSTK
jgi:hypothetical protein